MTKNFFQQIADMAVSTIEGRQLVETVQTIAKGLYYCYGTGVEGDVAEFGTMTGNSAVAIAASMAVLNRKYAFDNHRGRYEKRAWFFDSFEGLPEARFEADRVSHHVANGIWGKGTCKGLNEIQFSQLISQVLSADNFTVKKGFFVDTVKEIPKENRFCFLHIDGDLYESAIDVLDHVFLNGQVAEGALILFDDWNCNMASPNAGERLAWREIIEKYEVSFSDEGSYGALSRKFIVHKYRYP